MYFIKEFSPTELIITRVFSYLNEFQQVRVEAKEKGFQINVLTESSCPGLLVFILEAFEELGLDVLQARVSCSSSFHLEAVGGKVRDQKPFCLFHLYTTLTCFFSIKIYT